MDCSPTNRERELGLDRRETGYIYPTDGMGIVTVIEASTRGTLHSDNWYLRLVERPSPRSYICWIMAERL